MVEIYTDGGSKNGVGSWAFILSEPGKNPVEKAGRVERGNCNVMEFRAAIEALRFLPEGACATVLSDSRIVVDAMRLGDGPPAYRAEIETLIQLTQTRTVVWKWVKSHSGNELNERCDALCVAVRDL